MTDIGSASTRKIVLVIIILIFVISGLLIFRFMKTPGTQENQSILPDETTENRTNTNSEVLPGAYKIIIDKQYVTLESSVKATVLLSAVGQKIDGTDIILRFDPKMLQSADEIETGNIFQNYPQKTVDNAKGSIKVTAYGTSNVDLNDNEEILTVTFKPLQKGSARVWFEFQPRSTNTTTIVQKGTSKNILGTVTEETVNIQ